MKDNSLATAATNGGSTEKMACFVAHQPVVGIPAVGPFAELMHSLFRPLATELGVSLNTTPSLLLSPPAEVVPYRLPLASNIRVVVGEPPSEPPVKLYSTLSVNLPFDS